jgi:hypothetical protein
VGKKDRDYAASLENAVNFAVAEIYKLNVLEVFSYVFMHVSAGL